MPQNPPTPSQTPKQLMGRRRLVKHTEMRDGAVYKIAFLGEIWISLDVTGFAQEQQIAREAGGDSLASCPYDGRDHVQKIATEKLWVPCNSTI